ncbi:hypothetical protein XaC1_341 [Xanthomonas phage XaC1]|nr:hypothetical protein XaC1_341 [Xanthomonas phage XaC1]
MAKSKSSSSILTQPLNTETAKEIKRIIAAGAVYKQAIADANDGLKDLVEEGSAKTGVDKSVLKEVIATVFKQDYLEKTEKRNEVEAVLAITGQLPTKGDE